MDELRDRALQQFATIKENFEKLDSKKTSSDYSGGISRQERWQFLTSCHAFIARVSPPGSAYQRQAAKALEVQPQSQQVPILYGVASALAQDVGDGYTQDLTELVHANTFSDFAEMADHLLHEGYKDAAAVLLSGVLESHLRNLAIKHSIDVFDTTTSGQRPRRAERLNEELAKVAYNRLEQKTVTSWLDLRNKAAHAQYTEYSIDQVRLLSQGVKDFMIRHAA
ncbi:hypothetical protein AB0K00_08170 [Dactylosporangium sp. NPDC049525]|uniref:hypothetical protein n=1 Tax=Dactylosporangium sp. NPDC049525 TaxID=3154730 RepID=UPI003449C044